MKLVFHLKTALYSGWKMMLKMDNQSKLFKKPYFGIR